MLTGAAAALMLAVAAPSAGAAPVAPPASASAAAIDRAIHDKAKGPIKAFYAGRNDRPLWAADGQFGTAAAALIEDLRSADLDGLRPGDYHPDTLERLVDGAGGDPRRVARAELALSSAFARYVRDLRRGGAAMTYADPALRPASPAPEAVLRAASFPASFDRYVTTMGWMSPLYVQLRRLMPAASQAGDREGLRRLRLNLDRARVLPGPWTAHVLVDASSGRLWYYEDGRQVGTMRVVVGASATQTPMLAGTLHWAVLNPYWNVPTYLARQSIAPKVLAGRSLRSLNMEALSDWSADAHAVPASAIDWRAVAAGTEEVRLRELPGTGNSMGRVKFVFPNDDGIYLHDTPKRELLAQPDRHFSNGCIRLEHADQLGRWLLQRPLPALSRQREQAVALPVGVPVYLTYITATEDDGRLAFRPDVYNRDG